MCGWCGSSVQISDPVHFEFGLSITLTEISYSVIYKFNNSISYCFEPLSAFHIETWLNNEFKENEINKRIVIVYFRFTCELFLKNVLYFPIKWIWKLNIGQLHRSETETEWDFSYIFSYSKNLNLVSFSNLLPEMWTPFPVVHEHKYEK